jgi:hypothetical protein
MGRIKNLYPLPGAKWRSKYDFLKPLESQDRICEPFMGAACRSLINGLPATVGEINISQRAIAQATTRIRSQNQYIREYEESRRYFLDGIDTSLFVNYGQPGRGMDLFYAENPDIGAVLIDRWKNLATRLFAAVAEGDPSPGLYSFCQRSCFGNVMRLDPSGEAYNISWHVCKLKSAINFAPIQWCERLKAQNWNPTVLNSWQEAIAAVKRPHRTYLLLDPPYIEEAGKDRKMTPCYPGHSVTGGGRAKTYALSIDPIAAALNRGFPLIHFTNYYSAQLDADVSRMAHEAGYLCDRLTIGICGALGNSNGQYKHGDRADKRPEPIECLWTLRPFTQIALIFD